ncbi:hypothetical protein [Flavobacterium sp. S87F.05.LMB.W.Kidney.N]|uniref:hypothetical protein n=1 Tax=Flavobacterium sp. S87F.05.LMB.W.Kidney.N TaxID=1278758 RepID=UPI00106700A0|nr:hypothetical protein [Flavobacterium sp. S87F.05.LMB.W.Kidney.N]TDX11211.1 hypothetical protein EDB96_1989 [Flavobacterium sp. S87F.05.LMB.W.Kidney.N]
MGILLYLVAVLLFLPLTCLNIIVVVWKNSKSSGFFKSLDQYFFTGAIGLDIFANYEFRTLWNTILRKRNGYQFGTKGETISSALGKNQINKKLSFLGWILVYILWTIDYRYWKKGGHCANSIIYF